MEDRLLEAFQTYLESPDNHRPEPAPEPADAVRGKRIPHDGVRRVNGGWVLNELAKAALAAAEAATRPPEMRLPEVTVTVTVKSADGGRSLAAEARMPPDAKGREPASRVWEVDLH